MKLDLRQQTIDVYNQNALAMAKKFRATPPRLRHINAALDAFGASEPKVLEIGCGDGRDAKEIVKLAGSYLGIDISEELIKLAKEYVPNAEFEVADAVTFRYPKKIDIVLAFASFLHLSEDEVKIVLDKLAESVVTEGIVYLSLKWAPDYKMETNVDRFGERQYYFYNQELIAELAGANFTIEKSWRETLPGANHTEWIEIILRKV